MKTRMIHQDQGQDQGQRVFAVILETGDEIRACLEDFAAKQKISAAGLTAIGAFQRGTLRYFDWQSKEYQPIEVTEQVEVVSLLGDIALDSQDKPKLHLHAVLGRRDGSTLGGDLGDGVVRPTLEVIVTESPAHLRRVHDAETGLALIRMD